MNTREIAGVLKNPPYTKSRFQGVYPSDRLPTKIQCYPAAFVANVDPQGQPGSHWCAFYFDKGGNGEFFDSYGRKPQDLCMNFKHFLENICKEWMYNTRELQSLDSNVCGHYCIYYLINRCRNIHMKTIVNRFTTKTLINDRFVYHFIVKHFGYLIRLVKDFVKHQTSKNNKKRS